MESNVVVLGQRVREVREAVGISQDQARQAIGVSQPTYSRIEAGSRALKGDELVLLADCFGVRAAAISGLAQVRDRARFAARTDGSYSPMGTMKDRLYAYLELDGYLNGQGIAQA